MGDLKMRQRRVFVRKISPSMRKQNHYYPAEYGVFVGEDQVGYITPSPSMLVSWETGNDLVVQTFEPRRTIQTFDNTNYTGGMPNRVPPFMAANKFALEYFGEEL